MLTGFSKNFLLPDQDSNLDKQNQNLSYYLYTIRQNAKRKPAFNAGKNKPNAQHLKIHLALTDALCTFNSCNRQQGFFSGK